MSVEQSPRLKQPAVVSLSVLGLAIVWSFWPILQLMAEQWDRSPDYSHGWVVPLLALGLLWSRKKSTEGSWVTQVGAGLVIAGFAAGMYAPADRLEWLSPVAAVAGVVGVAMLISEWSEIERPSPSWWGVPLILIGGVVQVVAARWYMEWFERLAILPMIAGCVLIACGWRTFRWCLPAIAFLFFMVPLPYTLEVALRDPLRSVGTTASTYLMQTIGLPAYAEGHVIMVDKVQIGVVEACSGLRMMMVFFALSTAMALIVERPLWQRVLILLSALPIALLSNIIRITVTGSLYSWGFDHLADLAFHDLAGWLMMPMGLAFLFAEIWFLDHLIIVEEDKPMAAGIGSIELTAPAAKA